MSRRDRRGRRIGRNRWREYITDAWFMADHVWWLEAEAVAIGYATELEEYRQEHPRPQLRDFMIQLASTWARPAACGCGCPPEMHVGEIGCPCGLPDEPPCEDTALERFARVQPEAGVLLTRP